MAGPHCPQKGRSGACRDTSMPAAWQISQILVTSTMGDPAGPQALRQILGHANAEPIKILADETRGGWAAHLWHRRYTVTCTGWRIHTEGSTKKDVGSRQGMPAGVARRRFREDWHAVQCGMGKGRLSMSVIAVIITSPHVPVLPMSGALCSAGRLPLGEKLPNSPPKFGLYACSLVPVFHPLG